MDKIITQNQLIPLKIGWNLFKIKLISLKNQQIKQKYKDKESNSVGSPYKHTNIHEKMKRIGQFGHLERAVDLVYTQTKFKTVSFSFFFFFELRRRFHCLFYFLLKIQLTRLISCI